MKILKGLPKNSKVHPDGLKVSSWDGKLALVIGPGYNDDTKFYPDKMARFYYVRFLTYDNKSIPANDAYIGREPAFSDFYKSQPYEKARAKIGMKFRDELEVGFTGSQEFLVQMKIKDLNPRELQKLEHYLDSKGYVDVTDVTNKHKVKTAEWKRALKMSEQELLDGSDNISYAVDDLVGRGRVKHWPPPGIYLTTRKGDLKSFMSQKGNTTQVESRQIVRDMRVLAGIEPRPLLLSK